MGILISDIIIRGKHAEIVKRFVEIGLFENNVDVFAYASMLGMYYGEKSEADDSGDAKIEVSRYLSNKRAELENILFVYLQHEKVFQHQPLSVPEVFNLKLESTNTKALIDDLKLYAYFGIEKLEEMYDEIIAKKDKDEFIQVSIDKYIHSKSELIEQVKNDYSSFYNTEDDPDIISILSDLQE